jgi:Glycosyl hydrolase family 76
MRTPTPLLSTLAAAICFAGVVAGSAQAASPALGASSHAASPAPGASARGASPALGASAPAPVLSAAQQRYLALAQAGVAHARQRWWDPRRRWYDARLNDRERYPLATIWDIVPLFQSLDAIAIAQPSAANRRALASFASEAERYLNRGLRPIPGYSPYPGDREGDTETWFDDNGWWGLGFVEAYRATGARRYLRDAERALRYIAAAGWDPNGGGIWWNTDHPFKSGPALAADTLLATLIYQQDRSPFALAQARKFIVWANTAGFASAEGLYADSSVSATPVDYIEAPLIYAQAVLCKLTGVAAGCERAEQLTGTALERFGHLLDFSPQYDAIYLQWMLALYALDGDPALYVLAADNATDAQTRAANGDGLYLLSWNGETLPAIDAEPGMLQTQAATTSLFAWLAVYPPPG